MVLSSEQEIVIQKYREGKNVFVTGPGGTGKSYLLREIIQDSIQNNKRLQVCATSGRSAVLLGCGARTIHSWSGVRIPRGSREDIITKTLKRKNTKKMWKGVDILIIDEVSMMSLKLFEILNDVGKIARNNYSKIFGGIQLIFIGDFFQLPPIGDEGDIDSSRYCFESDLWNDAFPIENHIKLTKIFRQSDEKFIKILNQIREGRVTRSSHETLTRLIGKEYVDIENTGIVPVRLFPIRASADNFNLEMFNKIDSDTFDYKCKINLNTKSFLDDGSPIPQEIIQDFRNVPSEVIDFEIKSLIETSPCVECLSLKIGTNVMLTYNLNVETGLCNGSLGTVIGFEDNSLRRPIIRFSSGQTIPIDYVSYQSANYPCISFSQIPLKQAWGLTIHSSQGATLDMAEIDIGSGIFAVGQTYVAISRVKSLEGLYLSGYDPSKIKVSKKVIDFYSSF